MKKYFIFKNFIDNDIINHYIDLSKKYIERDSRVGKTVQKEKKRRKDIFFTKKDCSKFDEIIFKKHKDFFIKEFNVNLEFRETYKLGTYYSENKGFYNPHTDTQGGMAHRKISIVLCLTKKEDYKGGLFKFTNLNKKFKLDKGDAVIFDSNLLHGVEPVDDGIRKVLISFLWDNEGEKLRKKNKINKNSNNYIPNIE